MSEQDLKGLRKALDVIATQLASDGYKRYPGDLHEAAEALERLERERDEYYKDSCEIAVRLGDERKRAEKAERERDDVRDKNVETWRILREVQEQAQRDSVQVATLESRCRELEAERRDYQTARDAFDASQERCRDLEGALGKLKRVDCRQGEVDVMEAPYPTFAEIRTLLAAQPAESLKTIRLDGLVEFDKQEQAAEPGEGA